jgi:hypothetical protein
MLNKKDKLYQLREHLSREVDIGLHQLERGEYTEYDANNIHTLIEEVKTEGRKRLTAHNIK